MLNLESQRACKLTCDQVADFMRVDVKRGLPHDEVAARCKMYGKNEFDAEDEESLLSKYLDQFKNPLIILLLISAGVSLLMQHYDDAISITLAIVIVVTVAFVQEYRSEKSLEALNKLVPYGCHCIRDGRIDDLPAAELVPGDLVFFSIGDRVPADVRLLEAVDLQIDESSLTGETKTSSKYSAVITEGTLSSVADRRNMAFLGTLVRVGRGKGIVTGTGAHSEFGHVFHTMQGMETRKTPLQMRMDDLGKKLSAFSFGIIGLIMLIGLLQRRNMVEMFTIGVSLAVAAIPEGLPIVVTVTLALGVIRMAGRKAIVKKLPAVEALGSATVVCSDKTGTLTENKMCVTDIYVHADHIAAKVTGTGYETKGQILSERFVQTPPVINALLLTANLCNNSQLRDDDVFGQPTEGALLVMCIKGGLEEQRDKHERTYEMPFNSDQKWMAVKCSGIFHAKGSTDAILDRCTTYMCRDGSTAPLTSMDRTEINNMTRQMSLQGQRIISFAQGQDTGSLTFIGLVAIVDPPREGVSDSISLLLTSGVKVTMITGDAQPTAEAIAEKLGFFDRNVHVSLSGAEIDAMSDYDLQSKIEATRVFYRTSPRHKMRIVGAYQAHGEVVAMTGDGVNDAPALKLADIGVAMGKSGTDVAKEAADMILVDDNFSTIMYAIEEGKGIAYNINNFLRFQLSTSVAALSLITLSTLVGFENPLNAMQILWINILMDGPPAQSLGLEPVTLEVMKRPPRDPKAPIITRSLIINVLTAATLIVSGTLYVYWSESSDAFSTRDTTMTFTTFVFFDMFNALSCRSPDRSVFQLGLTTNTPFLYAVGGSIIGQLCVVYFPPLQAVFQTESLSLWDLLFITSIASSVFVVDELRKWFANRALRHQAHPPSSPRPLTSVNVL